MIENALSKKLIKLIPPLIFTFFFTLSGLYAQKAQKRYVNPDVIEGTLVKETVPLRDFVEPPFDGVIVKGEKLGYHPKSDWVLNDSINPNAKPAGMDPAWQTKYAAPNLNKALDKSFEGLGYSGVNPPDPAVDVGPNHVIQMINGSGGAFFIIYDKDGNVLQGQTYFDSFTGIGGLGDPIVLYDQGADRWMMSEFSASGNLLVVAISQTPDPEGAWYVYSYQATNFPDYPKYGIWNDAYIVTSNENSPAIYALDRTQMLAGTAGSAQRFTAPSYGTIGFQALTPVDVDGDNMPDANSPALVMRMADDAWDTNLSQDQLEIFELDIDFATPSNTTFTEVQNIATDPFDTHLCGYTSFSCIEQSGSGTTLDPLREVLMNRIMYRRFGSYEAMVMSHVTDVTGGDDAGIRWYELRRSTPSSNWTIYQQGTYAPDSESRWMSAIGINADGSIGLAYSTSSSSTFPSLKYTGRKECDPLGTMTEPETTIVAGTSPNGSNRYGDYAAMGVDPSDGSFWFTGEYNPASNWSTRVAQFSIGLCTPVVSFSGNQADVNEQDASVNNNCLPYQEVTVTIGIGQAASVDPTVTLSLAGSATQGLDYAAPANLSATLTAANPTADFVFQIYNDAVVETVEDIIVNYTLNANGGDATTGSNNQSFTINITSEDIAPINAGGSVVSVFLEDFESNSLGQFTTTNPSGDTPWAVGTAASASSDAITIPSPPSGSIFAFINDDACDCVQNDVIMESNSIDLSAATAASLSFDYYYEDNTYQGDQEDLDVEISIDGGSTYTLLQDLGGVTAWTAVTIDLTPYIGQSNVTIAFRYSDGTGWLYAAAVDRVEVEINLNVEVQSTVNTSVAAEEYLGANSTVHFYDPTSGNIMLSINNTSSHDYGCTTVEVDRAGVSALQFSSATTSDFVSSKTFKITPTNASSSGTYDLELYYTDAEITGWETATSNNRTDIEIVKVAGNNQISDVTPSNASSYTISYNPASLSNFNADIIVSASISSGFSGFALGIPNGPCSAILTNTWVGPASGNWHDNASNWSLGILPDYCHHVIIPATKDVTVQSGLLGKGYRLTVDVNANFEVVPGGLLDIIAPNQQ